MDETTAVATSDAIVQEAAPAPAQPEAQAPEIAMSEDGEVTFGDSFFAPPPPPPVRTAAAQEPAASTAPAPVPAADYTDDELKNTPWEQWDESRISGDVKRYIPFLQEQMRQREEAARQMRAAQMWAAAQRQQPESASLGPAAMSQKDIVAAAQKMARERLGLKDGDELDLYEPEHVAALSLAAQEVQSRNRAEIAQFQRTAEEQRQFGAFAAELASRADFADFDRWVTTRLAVAGMRPEQLQEYAARTGDIAGVQRTVAGWYQAWQAQKSQSAQNAQGQKQAPRPPVVETGTGAVSGKKVIDLREFGYLDEEDQARALLDAGLI